VIAVSPSFPALLPAILNARVRRLPWVLWLHDILPDGAAATGLVDEGLLLRASRALERLAYREADSIVVLSEAFIANLSAKGVPSEKVRRIYDPATRAPRANGASDRDGRPVRLLSMGNIGFSQGLAEVVRTFESDPGLNPDVRLVITGSGVAAEEMRREVRTGRVETCGLVSSERLEQELNRASLALVSQKRGGDEFNIPSKLMNFMMYGLPVVAFVDPRSEVARIVQASGGGWVVDNRDPARFVFALRQISGSDGEIDRRGASAREYALRNFSVQAFAAQFQSVLRGVAPAA
jgi:colanic acid biosynthesis glycosyl transferase WcaI